MAISVDQISFELQSRSKKKLIAISFSFQLKKLFWKYPKFLEKIGS